jgi:hypothetical protein
MIRRILSPFRRFRRREDGSMTIEFVILVPLFFSMFLASVEFGIFAVRQMFLDRGLDMTVRTIRLNTAIPFNHDSVKAMICQNSGFLSSGVTDNCAATLRLEMLPRDPRAFVALDVQADCVDVSQPVNPPRNFTNGAEHELMVLRACVKFDPVFPTTGLGFAFAKDGSGKAALLSTSAFVQEPL